MFMFMFKHLKEKKVTYMQHCIISLNISKMLLIAGVKALIHSFVPFLFETSSTDCIKELSFFMGEVYDNKDNK